MNAVQFQHRVGAMSKRLKIRHKSMVDGKKVDDYVAYTAQIMIHPDDINPDTLNKLFISITKKIPKWAEEFKWQTFLLTIQKGVIIFVWEDRTK